MADETTQAGEETSWWVFDAFADSELPSTSFDEPLEWPETLEWGDVGDADAELQFPGADIGGSYDLSQPIFPAAGEAPAPAPGPAATTDEGGDLTVAVAPLAALGGGAAPGAPNAVRPATHDPLPDSIWSADRPVAGLAAGPAATALGATTMVMADLDGGRGGGWRRRFDLRHGNAAVIALISFVSLVLLGMFMSVRARNDVPTDTSQTRTTSDQIAVQGTLNTVPLSIPSTSLGPPATINIADLVPAAEDATNAGSGGTAATTGTTAAPRATTATTQPAAQPTNTTAAPVETTTQTTAAPVTTATTRQPTTSVPPTSRSTIDITDFTITIPTISRPGRN